MKRFISKLMKLIFYNYSSNIFTNWMIINKSIKLINMSYYISVVNNDKNSKSLLIIILINSLLKVNES